MATKLEIINMAMITIGEPPLVDLGGTDTKTTAALLYYPQVLRTLESSFTWSFCRIQDDWVPAEDVTALENWNYSIDLPATCLRIESYPYPYEIIGAKFYCNEEEIAVQYIQYLDTEALFPNTFTEALIVSLATKLVTLLVDRGTLFDRLAKMYKATIARAYQTEEIVNRQKKEAFWVI